MDYQTTISELLDGTIPINLNPVKRKYWPRFAFHFTDINNAVEILKLGFICSRNYANNHNIMINDNASKEVLNNTHLWVRDMVRLYFRPRTPTQYYNEGFQTKKSRDNSNFSANCPVPIFFLFDLNDILGDSDVQFSDKSLALSTDTKLMSTPEDFRTLPFDEIYHDSGLGSMTFEKKEEIKQHKHAEIIKKDLLNLDKLKWIYVRSSAERETLINLLHAENIFDYDQVVVIGSESTFYMNRNYIKRVVLESNGINIESSVKNAYPDEWGDAKFALNPDNSDDFLDVKLKLIKSDGESFIWPTNDDQKALLKISQRLNFTNQHNKYGVEIYIDNHIAYKGRYSKQDDLPF